MSLLLSNKLYSFENFDLGGWLDSYESLENDILKVDKISDISLASIAASGDLSFIKQYKHYDSVILKSLLLKSAASTGQFYIVQFFINNVDFKEYHKDDMCEKYAFEYARKEASEKGYTAVVELLTFREIFK